MKCLAFFFFGLALTACNNSAPPATPTSLDRTRTVDSGATPGAITAGIDSLPQDSILNRPEPQQPARPKKAVTSTKKKGGSKTAIDSVALREVQNLPIKKDSEL